MIEINTIVIEKSMETVLIPFHEGSCNEASI